jgi:hypothetical protein
MGATRKLAIRLKLPKHAHAADLPAFLTFSQDYSPETREDPKFFLSIVAPSTPALPSGSAAVVSYDREDERHGWRCH